MSGAKEFKVVALSLGGLRKRVFQSGDVVTADLLARPVDELILGGFIEPISDSATQAVKTAETATPSGSVGASESVPQESQGLPPYTEMTKKEILSLLAEKGISHDPKQSKKKLYALFG